MSGKCSQWGLLAIVVLGLAALILSGKPKPATETATETKVEAKAKPEVTKAKPAVAAKKVAVHAVPRAKEPVEQAPILPPETRTVIRN